MFVLGVESSCDESSVALVDDLGKIRYHKTLTQTQHQSYQGVFPELAARLHLELLPLFMDELLKDLSKLEIANIKAVACTTHPGLIGSLIVGMNFAKALAIALQVPFLPIHHLEGHILAAELSGELCKALSKTSEAPSLEAIVAPTTRPGNIKGIRNIFPSLVMLISGGHTNLIYTSGYSSYSLLSSSLDDACGECIDKSAKLLGLGYPGGPALEQLALQGDRNRFKFTIPLFGKLDFSFSGLKTAVMQLVKQSKASDYVDIAASLEKVIADTLIHKINLALQLNSVKYIVLVGGVAANKYLKSKLAEAFKNYTIIAPIQELCTDNAAMIAWAGMRKYLSSKPLEQHNSAKQDQNWQAPSSDTLDGCRGGCNDKSKDESLDKYLQGLSALPASRALL